MPYLVTGEGYQRTDTSYQAIPPRAATVRSRVLELLQTSEEPLTSEEIADFLNLPYASVQPRLSELQNAGLAEDSGERGSSRFGKRIIRWCAA